MINFKAFGHPNLLAEHKNTLEFTKDGELTTQGDCIVGVRADFSGSDLKKFINGRDQFKLTIKLDDFTFECNSAVNPDFDDSEEIVLRRSEFKSNRTLGIRCEKAAIDIPREMVKLMKNPNTVMQVSLE